MAVGEGVVRVSCITRSEEGCDDRFVCCLSAWAPACCLPAVLTTTAMAGCLCCCKSRELTEQLIKASRAHMEHGVSSHRGGSFVSVATQQQQQLAAPGAAPTPLALPAPAGNGSAPPPSPGRPAAAVDDLASLLESLAAVFRVRPALWFNNEAPEATPHVASFMSYVAVHPCMQLPDVRVSFLGVLAALASDGPRGSRFCMLQFRQNAGKQELEHFTWRKLTATIVAYCRCDLLLQTSDNQHGDDV